MIVGEAAKCSGLPAKTLRYYEEIGLVAPERRDNGYRDYSDEDISRLKFLKRARSLGFSVDECRKLLLLCEDENRTSAEVKKLAHEHLSRVEKQIEELQALRQTLKHLISSCHGDERHECPILDDLAGR